MESTIDIISNQNTSELSDGTLNRGFIQDTENFQSFLEDDEILKDLSFIKIEKENKKGNFSKIKVNNNNSNIEKIKFYSTSKYN